MFSLWMLLGMVTIHSQANVLSLQEYLNQVEGKSPAVSASKNAAEGALEASTEGSMVTKPQFFAQYSHLRDEKESVNPIMGGNLTLNDSFSTGIQEQFGMGLNAKLSYNILSSDTHGMPATFYPGGRLQYVGAYSQLELSQSLWRNFWGKETRATADMAEAASLSTHFAEKYKSKQLIAQAESTYYRLSIAREAVKLSQEVLDRAHKLLDWTTKRVNVHLADKIDKLQATAAHQTRELELSTQLDEERSARLAFNALRNLVSEEVSDELIPMSTDRIMEIVSATPHRAEVSNEVKAAEQNERAVVASHELAGQKVLPDLSLFGSVAYNGVDQYLSPALGETFTSKHPTYLIGVKFTMPLYFWDASTIRSGREKEQLAAEAQTRQKRLENDQSWRDLTKRLEEAKARLKLADSLVSAQKEKLDYEKYRLNLGRTTTYQVLTFEQDYEQSVIARLRIENELLNINSQLKTFTE